MYIIEANSAAQGFLKATDHLIKNVKKENGLVEILNAVIEFSNFSYSSLEIEFDKKFREIFGDERIDYAKSVTFIEPMKVDDKFHYQTIKDGWKNSYWGRMTDWEGKINQFENVIKTLKTRKNTKRCEMIIYNPQYDMKSMFKQPCLLSMDIKPRGEDLFITGTFRSQRITKSGYADYTALIEMGQWLANETGYNLKKVTNIAHSLHLGGVENNELPNTKNILSIFNGKF